MTATTSTSHPTLAERFAEDVDPANIERIERALAESPGKLGLLAYSVKAAFALLNAYAEGYEEPGPGYSWPYEQRAQLPTVDLETVGRLALLVEYALDEARTIEREALAIRDTLGRLYYASLSADEEGAR